LHPINSIELVVAVEKEYAECWNQEKNEL